MTFKYRIETDTDPQHPRKDFDQMDKMVCWHNRHNLGDEQPSESAADYLWNLANYQYDVPWWPENEIIEKAINRIERNGYEILPLYLYDHSGLRISTSPFSCRWDSGQVGWIYIDKKTVLENWPKSKRNWRKKALEVLESSVKEYDQYLSGDVCGYIVDRWDMVGRRRAGRPGRRS